MSDDSTGSSDDLWANTRPEPDTDATPTPPTGEQPAAMPPPDPDATTVQPSAGGPPPPTPGDEPPPAGAEPTTVQPTVGPAGTAAGAGAGTAAGAYMGSGGVPPEPPVDEYGDGFDEPRDWRPRWLLPAAIALLVALIIGLIAVLATRDNGDDESDESTTTSSEVSTTTEPVFVPVDSGATSTAEATTSEAPTTEAPTTLAPTTLAPTTQAPTTQAPTTQAPTTQPPTTQPPTTVPAFPDPGFAFVDDQTVPIEATCRVDPDSSDRDIVAYVVDSSSGRMVIERWFGGGSNGVDVDLTWADEYAAASPVDSASVTDPFSATATGDFTVDVAVNPPSGGPDNCQDSIQTSDGGSTHDYAVVDVCTAGVDVAGIGTEGSRFGAIDNGDETAELAFSDRSSGELTDPAAMVAISESIYNYTGTVTGGGQSLGILIDLDLATPRACSADEAP